MCNPRITFRDFTIYAALVFTVGWFGLFIPGHPRGIVTLPTTQAQQASTVGQPQCPMCVQRDPDAAEDEQTADMPQSPDGSCAVCHIKMGLNLPPAQVAFHLETWLLDELSPLPYLAQHKLAERHFNRLGRAPPLG